MATPFGWRGLLFPFALTGMKTLGGIGEWRAPDFQTIQPIEVALMAALYVGFSRGVKVPVPRLLVVLGVLHMALQHTRHQMIAGLVGALILAAPFGRALATAPIAVAVAAPSARGKKIGTAIAGCVIALTVLRVAYPAARVDGPTSPITALAHVPKSLADQPVLNQYDFGGYLIFHGVRPFIDARADMYGDAFLNQYADITRPDPALLEQTLASKNIRWTILAANSPALAVMDGLSGWRRLYADAFAVVHVRDNSK
jgi:hypothetical protein